MKYSFDDEFYSFNEVHHYYYKTNISLIGITGDFGKWMFFYNFFIKIKIVSGLFTFKEYMLL